MITYFCIAPLLSSFLTCLLVDMSVCLFDPHLEGHEGGGETGYLQEEIGPSLTCHVSREVGARADEVQVSEQLR